jgi:hypothetical protein
MSNQPEMPTPDTPHRGAIALRQPIERLPCGLVVWIALEVERGPESLNQLRKSDRASGTLLLRFSFAIPWRRFHSSCPTATVFSTVRAAQRLTASPSKESSHSTTRSRARSSAATSAVGGGARSIPPFKTLAKISRCISFDCRFGVESRAAMRAGSVSLAWLAISRHGPEWGKAAKQSDKHTDETDEDLDWNHHQCPNQKRHW